MPTLGFHVPDESDLLKKIKQKAKANHSNKVSEYVRFAVERDLSNDTLTPNALSPTILTDLAARLLGELDTQDLARILGDYSQPRALQNLLIGILQGTIRHDTVILRASASAGIQMHATAKPKPLPKSG
jgi:hypothetical protein